METIHHVYQALRAHTLYKTRRRLRRQKRRSHHRRRIHRTRNARPPLVGRLAPGRGSQGRRQDRARKSDARHDHLPELFPHVQKTFRHDRNGGNRGRRVQQDLQPGCLRSFPPIARCAARNFPTWSTARPKKNIEAVVNGILQEDNSHANGIRQIHEARPARAGRHDFHRKIRSHLRESAEKSRHPAPGLERQAARARSKNHRASGPQGRGHRFHQHGGPRHGHSARRQSRSDDSRPLPARTNWPCPMPRLPR